MREGQPKMPFLGRKQLSREKPQVFLFFFFSNFYSFIYLFFHFRAKHASMWRFPG